MVAIRKFVHFGDLMRDFVFGMEDGLVSNLGLVLGVFVGGGNNYAILLAGLASMFAGAFSMSAGTYLSAKSQREVYEQEILLTKERLKTHPVICLREARNLLKREGLKPVILRNFFQDFSAQHHPEFICNYLVQKKVGISKSKLDLPLRNAVMMFFSFLVGSSFPIIAFFFFQPSKAAIFAVFLTFFALVGVGLTKSYYTKRHWLKSCLEIVFVGAGAGVIGYLIGLILNIMF